MTKLRYLTNSSDEQSFLQFSWVSKAATTAFAVDENIDASTHME